MPITFGIYLVTDLTGVIHYISFIIQFQRGGLSQQASLSLAYIDGKGEEEK